MGSIIKVEHLSYVYNPGMPNAVTALDDVSFEVEEGDFVGIIGATGSGKSTLITHMNGLNKPTSGKIFIDGRDLWAEPEKIRDFRFLTGLVFQYPEYQLFEETCYKDIAKYADRVLVMSNKKIAMYDTVEQVFARAPELLALGLSVPQVTKIFLKLREMGVDVPADVYTVPYAVKMILEAKQRRDAGESLVLPREQSRKGGVSEC